MPGAIPSMTVQQIVTVRVEKMKEKKCCLCRQVKPMEEYYRRAQSPNGRAARCKLCSRKGMNARREAERLEHPGQAYRPTAGRHRKGNPDDQFGDSGKWLAVAMVGL